MYKSFIRGRIHPSDYKYPCVIQSQKEIDCSDDGKRNPDESRERELKRRKKKEKVREEKASKRLKFEPGASKKNGEGIYLEVIE